ncbi:hypothetical protein HRG_012714 [Hirsutella rhossiliensis]
MPASQWGREHLLACRIIRRDTQSTILPILSQSCRPMDAQYSTEIQKFLDAQSEHQLVHSYGVSLGQVWAAMSMLSGPGDRRSTDSKALAEDDDAKVRPKRAGRSTRQDNYVDSSMIQVGSSSPLHESSSASSSMNFIDMDSHALLVSPEDETLRFTSCVIRHLLYFTSPQESRTLPIVVEFRDNKTRLAAFTPVLARRIVATDDGGLCLRQKLYDGVFAVGRNRVAILETKKRFQHIESGKPIISDESLVARLADPLGELDNRYLAPTTFIYVNSTPWFDLCSRSGRKHVVSNICSMIHWARVNYGTAYAD